MPLVAPVNAAIPAAVPQDFQFFIRAKVCPARARIWPCEVLCSSFQSSSRAGPDLPAVALGQRIAARVRPI